MKETTGRKVKCDIPKCFTLLNYDVALFGANIY